MSGGLWERREEKKKVLPGLRWFDMSRRDCQSFHRDKELQNGKRLTTDQPLSLDQ